MSGIELEGRVAEPDVAEEDRRLPPGGLIPVVGTVRFTAIFQHVWEFYTGPAAAQGGEWLPHISELRHKPGGNGVRVPVANGPTNATAAVVGLRNKRGIEARLGDPRLGSFAKYLARHDMRNGKVFWCYRWVKIRLINNGRNAVPKIDHAQMVAFRRQWLAGGIIDAMPREALDSELLVIENRITRWRSLLSEGRMTDTAYAANVEQATATMEAMSRAYQRQFGEADVVESRGVDLDPTVVEPDAHEASEIEIPPAPTAIERPDPKPRRGGR